MSNRKVKFKTWDDKIGQSFTKQRDRTSDDQWVIFAKCDAHRWGSQTASGRTVFELKKSSNLRFF
jgi:hypothetical protein